MVSNLNELNPVPGDAPEVESTLRCIKQGRRDKIPLALNRNLFQIKRTEIPAAKLIIWRPFKLHSLTRMNRVYPEIRNNFNGLQII